MNELDTHARSPLTRFADGLPRRAWTVSEFEKAAKAGLFGTDGVSEERLELLGGEIVPMSPKGQRHELVRSELHDRWSAVRSVKVAAELALALSETSHVEPDIVVYPRRLTSAELGPEDILLIVEIADSSLEKDLNAKARLYADAGIREYWVIEATSLVATIFRDPSTEGYQHRLEVPPSKTVAPFHAPELAIALTELGI